MGFDFYSNDDEAVVVMVFEFVSPLPKPECPHILVDRGFDSRPVRRTWDDAETSDNGERAQSWQTDW
jgi:hypothetical protein